MNVCVSVSVCVCHEGGGRQGFGTLSLNRQGRGGVRGWSLGPLPCLWAPDYPQLPDYHSGPGKRQLCGGREADSQ